MFWKRKMHTVQHELLTYLVGESNLSHGFGLKTTFELWPLQTTMKSISPLLKILYSLSNKNISPAMALLQSAANYVK